jgi:ribosomal protein S18 acetylase RimI-like enzyme
VKRVEYAGPVRLRAMQFLAERVSPATGYRHIGDLAWNWTLYHDRPQVCPTALWYAGDTVVAWAWLELPGALMAQVDPDRPDLADEVLAWAERRAGTGPAIEVCRTETALVDALAGRGYRRRQGPFMACLSRGLSDLPPPRALTDGFTCRPVRLGDAPSRAAVHRAAFDGSRLSTQRYRQMTGAWPYRPDFDIVVETPTGELAAYCQGWYDEANGIGEFEPVGCDPRYARRGLASAACLAVLRAFAAAGGRRAVVYSRGDEAYPVPKLVYESLGFTAYARTDWYVRHTDRSAGL